MFERDVSKSKIQRCVDLMCSIYLLENDFFINQHDIAIGWWHSSMSMVLNKSDKIYLTKGGTSDKPIFRGETRELIGGV